MMTKNFLTLLGRVDKQAKNCDSISQVYIGIGPTRLSSMSRRPEGSAWQRIERSTRQCYCHIRLPGHLAACTDTHEPSHGLTARRGRKRPDD